MGTAAENAVRNVQEPVTVKQTMPAVPVIESCIQFGGNEVTHAQIVEKVTDEYTGRKRCLLCGK